MTATLSSTGTKASSPTAVPEPIVSPEGRSLVAVSSGPGARRGPTATEAELGPAPPSSGAVPDTDPARWFFGPRWIPWIFAAKTTAAGLLALLVAFTFNLDQPQWALLTVFIVSQPKDGLVLAKSFYRIIGTVIGAGGALVLVALFAQERVLFLGALAVWIAFCTFGSQYARNWAAYGFVLSGYTVAIVGIPGALDPGNAFFIAVARVSEISLGIMTAAAVSHLVLPMSLAGALRRAVATGRADLADYAAALLLGGRDTTSLRTKLLGQVVAIENLRASAVFEDREIQNRSGVLRRLDIAMLGVVDVAHLLGRSLDWLRRGRAVIGPGLDGTLTRAAAAIDVWRGGKLDAAGLSRRLVQASASLPLARELCLAPFAADEDVIRCAAVIGRLREFFAAMVVYAEADQAFAAGEPGSNRRVDFGLANDFASAVWTGLRAALAVLLVSGFWIAANWPHGPTAVILAAVATARLATMGHAVPLAIAATLIFSLSTIPAFVLVETLLPLASGFAMFALVVAPMLFLCAFMMAHERTMVIGFLSALLFASVGAFQNRMVYDPIGLVNTSIAATLAAAVAMILWAIVAPETPEAAHRRFGRAARKLLARIAAPRPRIGLAEFETAMTEALDRLRGHLRPDRPADLAALDAGTALLITGRELIRVRDDGRPTPAKMDVEDKVVRFLASNKKLTLDRALRAAQDASVTCLAELRDDRVGVAEARTAVREMVAFAAIRDELERGGELLLDERATGAPAHVA